MKDYTPYIPTTVGEVMEILVWFMIPPPGFRDKSGYFPGQTIDTEYRALVEGLANVRKRIGEDRYELLNAKAQTMRLLFDKELAGDDAAGLQARDIIFEMEDLLTKRKTVRPA